MEKTERNSEQSEEETLSSDRSTTETEDIINTSIDYNTDLTPVDHGTEYSTEVTPVDYSTELTQVKFSTEYSSEVTPVDYSTEVTPVDYSTEVTPIKYSTELTPVAFRTDVTQTEYRTGETQTEYSTEVTPISTDRSPTDTEKVGESSTEYKKETQMSKTGHFTETKENKSESSEDTTLVPPDSFDRLVEEIAEPRHKLCFTPPLNRPKDPTKNSVGIMQEWRKDGLLCSTPLIPRNTRQTRSGISFEYFFGPSRAEPRILPRLKSTGNIGETIGQRKEVPRKQSPLKQKSFKRKSACKTYRWHSGCRAAMERRRLQREMDDRRRIRNEKEEWKMVGQFWHEVRLKQEKERKEDEQRRVRERKILHELLGKSFKDTLSKNNHP